MSKIGLDMRYVVGAQIFADSFCTLATGGKVGCGLSRLQSLVAGEVRACVRVCVRVCACACVRACVYVLLVSVIG